jgi:hypothetical protein
MSFRRGLTAILAVALGALAAGACSLAVSTDGLSDGALDGGGAPLDGALDDGAPGTTDARDDGAATDGDARAFPPEAQIWPVNGHGYAIYIVSNGLSWTEARARAEQAGGHLVTIASADENDFVLGLVNDRPDAFVKLIGPWLGGYQPSPTATEEPIGGWQWVDGTPWGYTAWASSQPDDTGGVEGYLDIYRPSGSLGWNDDAPRGTGGSVISYVVELE